MRARRMTPRSSSERRSPALRQRLTNERSRATNLSGSARWTRCPRSFHTGRRPGNPQPGGDRRERKLVDDAKLDGLALLTRRASQLLCNQRPQLAYGIEFDNPLELQAG
jgi:hypothetical protein